MLCTALVSSTLLVSQAPAQGQSAEAVAKVAQTITVRIEGATEGSGVLVKRAGNRYTVLTAWHVVSGQRPGEELDIYTHDGEKHQLEQGSIKKIGTVDMAVLTFSSSTAYGLARVGDANSVSSGSSVYVSGFPLSTSAVPTRLFRFLKGDVISNATVDIPNGYQLLYSNPTLPGMSGGAVLSAQGQLVGIHGQGETDSKISEREGVAVKTGTNQAVPIYYYVRFGKTNDLAQKPKPKQDLQRNPNDMALNKDYLPTYSQIDQVKAAQLGRRAAWDSLADNQQEQSPTIPDRPRMVLGLVPSSSGGLTWPDRNSNDSLLFKAWQISSDGLLEIQTNPNSYPKAFYEEGRGSIGPRIWIDVPESASIRHTVTGIGPITEVRFGSPNKNSTRMVVQFRQGVKIDPSRLRLVGISPVRWRMPIGLSLPWALGEGILEVRSSIKSPYKPSLFDGPTYRPHKVKPGETLSEIAENYSTTALLIMQLNHLRSAQDLWEGSTIFVPNTSH